MGDKKSRAVPIYYRDRILFEPCYSYEPIDELVRWNGRKYVKDVAYVWNGQKFTSVKDSDFFELRAQGVPLFRRLVEREASKFFRDNVKEIYEKKVEFYQTLFDSCSKDSFWLSRGFSEKESRINSQSVRDYMQIHSKSSLGLARDYLCYCGVKYCYAVDAEPCLVWFSRFGYESDKPYGDLIPADIYHSINQFYIDLFGKLRYSKKPKHDYLLDEIKDFFNSN